MPVPPGPTQRMVRAVDPVLTGVINDRGNDAADYIGDLAFVPNYEDGRVTGTYFRRINAAVSFGNRDIRRATGGPYAEIGLNLTTAAFSCEEFGVNVKIDRKLMRQSQVPLDLLELAALVADDEVRLQRDIRIAAAMFVVNVWGDGAGSGDNALGAAAQWDDGGGVPLQDLWTSKRFVKLNSRKTANTGVIGWDGLRVALLNGDVTGLLPSAIRRSMVTLTELEQRLAEGFDLSRFFVGKSVRNTAAEGQAEVNAFTWTDNLWVGYVPDSGPQLCAFMQYASTDGGAPTVAERWFDPETNIHGVRAREERDEVVCDSMAGHLTLDLAN